jgi:hypothetical protein
MNGSKAMKKVHFNLSADVHQKLRVVKSLMIQAIEDIEIANFKTRYSEG